jgi:hypothetical protein
MTRAALITAFAIALAVGSAAVAPHDEDGGPGQAVYKVGQNGEVKIGDRVSVGDVVVPKGKYRLDHHVEGSTHVVVLTGLDSKASAAPWTHEFRMQLIPEKQVAKRSAIFADELPNGSLRLSVIQIAREAGDHLIFGATSD